MPTGWVQAIPRMMELIMENQPASVLDVGAGLGKYGVLLRELDAQPKSNTASENAAEPAPRLQIDGVETIEGRHSPLYDDIYDRVFYSPVLMALPELPVYDVIVMGNLLETFIRPEGEAVLRGLLEHTAKALILSTSLQPPVDGKKESTSPAYKSRWSAVDFQEYDLAFSTVKTADSSTLIVALYPNARMIAQNEALLSRDEALLSGLVSAARPQQDAPTARSNVTSIEAIRSKRVHRQMNLAYILPPQGVSADVEMLRKQVRWLRGRGHKVRIFKKTSGVSTLPGQRRGGEQDDTVLPADRPFSEAVRGFDVVVSGWFGILPELVRCGSPVMYWEQGSEILFGDFQSESAALLRGQLRACFSLPVVYTAASEFVAGILYSRYGRRAAVIPGGMDTGCFFPSQKPKKDMVLLAGDPVLPYKDFLTAISALELLWKAGRRFRVRWICSSQPRINGISFPVDFVVSPAEQDIPAHYRGAGLLLFTSQYEGFSITPLRAMASGVPVVCTDCGGLRDYIRPGQNALVADAGDVASLAAGVDCLLQNEQIRDTLADKARDTALYFGYNRSFTRLEELLLRIKNCGGL